MLSRKKNASASNWDFAEKKLRYFAQSNGGASAFALTTQVLKADDWTLETLKERQALLVSKLSQDLMLDQP